MTLTYAKVLREIARQHFAVLSTSDTAGTPASAGVTYGLAPSGDTIYVMTRRHLQKARNIAVNAEVSLVIPVPRKLVWTLPPATIQLRGQAEIVDWTDTEARGVFSGFWLGQQSIKPIDCDKQRPDLETHHLTRHARDHGCTPRRAVSVTDSAQEQTA